MIEAAVLATVASISTIILRYCNPGLTRLEAAILALTLFLVAMGLHHVAYVAFGW